MRDQYVIGPAEGTTRYSVGEGEQLLTDWHTRVRVAADCHHPGTHAEDEYWCECEIFALARVRGVQHTVWVVQQPGFTDASEYIKFAIVDCYDGGPDDPYYDVITDLADYRTALTRAAGDVAAEPEWS